MRSDADSDDPFVWRSVLIGHDLDVHRSIRPFQELNTTLVESLSIEEWIPGLHAER
jgi:hypothetical protein